MSILWNSNGTITQMQQQQQNQPTQRSQPRSRRNSKQHPLTRAQKATALSKSNSHLPRQPSSTDPNAVFVPETNLTSVLAALVNIVKKQLTQPPQRSLFVPPKHLGYNAQEKDEDGSTGKTYYPMSVRAEDTHAYFRDLEHKQIEKKDLDGKNLILRKVPLSSADNQRYPFDRSAGNYIHNALEEENDKRKVEILDPVRKFPKVFHEFGRIGAEVAVG